MSTKKPRSRKKVAKKGIGRPTKLTAEVQEKIINAVREGNYRHVAAGLAGISEHRMSRWMNGRGEPYKSFRTAVLEAERVAEMQMVAVVRAAAMDDARHAEWWLERKFPDRWGRLDRAKIQVGDVSANDAQEFRRLMQDPETRQHLVAAAGRSTVVESDASSDGKETQ